ncbi:RNA polymerase sigma factor [Streptomyces virginiae]|uniref:RNA polymerase sigma factor n=1 Tax=Streptomyces virginiae TaxID=1961 RepID=UPI0036C9341B
MIQLTDQQIADAKANDITAVAAVVEAMEERIWQHAHRMCRTGGRTDATLAEDYAQTGRIAVWEGISRFNGSNAAEFFAFMDRTIGGKLADQRKTETRIGVSRSIASEFEKAVSICNGDMFAAEDYCTSEAMGKVRMSRDTAYAARLAWMGSSYLDAPLPNSRGVDAGPATLGDRLVAEYGLPEDLIEPRDIVNAQRRATIDKVNETLDRLSGQQQAVLSAEFGIGDFPCYGDDYRGLADVAGVPVASIDSVREEARETFRTVYLGGSPAADEGETKCCTTCNMHKPLDAFYIRNKATGARMATCSTCKRSATKRFRKEKPEARAAHKRTYTARKRDAAASA